MLNIIPYPNVVKINNGEFHLPEYIECEYGDFEAWCVCAFMERACLNIADNQDSKLKLIRDATLHREGYILEITNSYILIKASDEIGVINALTTFVNLIENRKVSCCYIEDEPRYSHRGLNLDCTRHYFPVSTVKKIIEEISLVRMNVLHWHISDDQGYRIESKVFPKLNEVSGEYYSHDEVSEIVEFARLRGVEIIPEIDLPGHVSAILAVYPEYGCFGKHVSVATCGGIYPIILCPGKDETFNFLEQLLEEVIPLFPGSRFHIGGDEAPKSEWEKCSYCTSRMKELGVTEYEDLQGYFTERVNNIINKHGKMSVCWNETLLANNYPPNIQIQYWTLQHRLSMQQFVEKGGQWIYSDMFEVYFDYPYSMSSVKKVYKTIPHLGKQSFADNKGLLGMEACMWTEHVDNSKRLEELLFPRIYAFAEICWSLNRDYSCFIKRLKQVILSPIHEGISFTDEDWWEPKGKARRTEAINYAIGIMSSMPEEVREETIKSTKPSREFAMSFMRKFFKLTDIPFLLRALAKARKKQT